MTLHALGNEVIVVGAGIAGLTTARTLADAGRSVRVFDRARGVGGRVATRRFEEQPVDYGVSFFHGSDPSLLAALDAVPATRLTGWPTAIHGGGRPCQPEAFAPTAHRLAFAEGLSVFPKHLARGLDLSTDSRVLRLAIHEGRFQLTIEGGEIHVARSLVLALAAEQARALLATIESPPPAIDGALALLDLVHADPCLTLIAGYPLETPAPPFEVSYPESSPALQLLVHDSTKRARPTFRAMVYQALPRWSHDHLDDPSWPAALLAEAARLLGPWAAAPRFTHPHRWRYARMSRGNELARPPLFTLAGGAQLGLAGELFAPGGGVEAAWISGRALAQRLLGPTRV